MHNTYLILRNNKELGPFSMEQLLELSVQPNDLIWVEGQSASWCYPADIPSLKTYFAPETPKAETKTVAEKPAVTASHIYVRLPANTMHTVIEAGNAGDTIEKKAEEIYQRIQAFAQQKQQQQAAGEPETGYSRSLTDLKEDYAAWYIKNNKKKEHRKQRRKLMVAALVLLIITMGFTFITWLRPSKLPAQKIKLEALSATVKNTEKKAPPELVKKPAVSHTTTAIELWTPPDALRIAAKPKTTTNKLKSSTVTNPVLTIPRAAVITPQAPKPELIENPMPRNLPLWQLISVNGQPVKNKNGNYITGMQVTVQNNSTQIIKKVTVHIYYYKNDDRLFEKQDLSFTNLQPKSTLTLPSQAGKKASTARFEVGAITRDDGSLYVK